MRNDLGRLHRRDVPDGRQQHRVGAADAAGHRERHRSRHHAVEFAGEHQRGRDDVGDAVVQRGRNRLRAACRTCGLRTRVREDAAQFRALLQERFRKEPGCEFLGATRQREPQLGEALRVGAQLFVRARQRPGAREHEPVDALRMQQRERLRHAAAERRAEHVRALVAERPDQALCVAREVGERGGTFRGLGVAAVALVVRDHGEVRGERWHQRSEHLARRFGAVHQHERRAAADAIERDTNLAGLDELDHERASLSSSLGSSSIQNVISIFSPRGSCRKS